MAFQNLSKEKQQQIRFKYRAKQIELTKDWARRKKLAGIPYSARMTQAAEDRMLMRRIKLMAEKSEAYCSRAVSKMFVGVPINARLKKPQSKTNGRDHRARLKARAVAIMGGRCVCCGFDDVRALQFDHIEPVRRGLNGLSKRAFTSTATHRAIVRGETSGVQLLCANCHAIKTSTDKMLCLNVKRVVCVPPVVGLLL